MTAVMSSDGVIREGLLCPICMQDLGTVSQLQSHFEESHSGEDKVVLKQLKELFSKAKKAILNEDEDGAFSLDESSRSVSSSSGGVTSAAWEPQELGVIRGHMDAFKRIRDARIDRFVVETNKLIIRLDKLVSEDAPTDPGKRKAFERDVVPWAPDGHVNLCPGCGRSFNIARRRHHCRLCGGIMCNKCSQFLPFSYGQKLTNPAFQSEGEVGFLKRSGSNSSLNSIMSPEGEPHIRTCWDCRVLLERRDRAVEQRNTNPPIVHIYQRLKSCIDDADYLQPEYQRIAESLNAGETSHGLMQAHELRNKIVHLYDTVDLLSKRIAALGLDQEELPSAKQLKLQRYIRAFASNYLHENMLTLQNLPSEDDYQKLRENREREIQMRLALERQAALEAANEIKKSISSERLRLSPKKEVKPDDSGWIPYEAANRSDDSDPMLLQMNIIRDYIKQAKQAQRLDEVRMLEDNLKDLQREYYQQMRGLNENTSPVT